MSEFAPPRPSGDRWWFSDGDRSWFVLCAILLALVSLALSVLTTTARAKLWLGPQTLVLGGVGLAIGLTVILFAWQLTRRGDAGLFERPLLPSRAVPIVIIGCAAVSLLILVFAFVMFPNSADEYGFLFQADTFRHGRLWNAPPADPTLFEQNYVIARDGIWTSQYLPGWPAVLALFETLRLPAWLAAPVCGALLLLLLWHALRLECRSPALVVALLLAYASSGFFLLNGATYFSHCASALTVLGCVVCMLRAECHDAWWWTVGAGVCCGLALLFRIDSAALAGVAALAAWVEQGCRRRTLLLGIAGALPPVLLFATYNWLITGSPVELPTAWAGNIGMGADGLQGVEATSHLRMVVQTFWRLGELSDTASLVIPALYIAALTSRIRARRLRFYDVVPPANFIIFLIFPDIGGFQMGPRYWFEGFLLMHLTIASVFSLHPATWRRFAVACCLLLVPVSFARLPALVAFQANVMHERSSMYRLGQTLPQNQRSIILVNNFFSTWNDRANRTTPNLAKDFARNGTRLDQPVLYARGDAPNAVNRACHLYPSAAVYAFHIDRDRPDGWLQPLACPGQAG